MKMRVVVNVAQRAIYVIWRKKMSEPRLDDDFALGKLDDLDEDGEPIEVDESYDTLEEKYED